MRLVLWIAGVFRHDSGVCHIVYGVWVVIKELCPPFYFYVWYHLVCIWMMMKTLAFWWSLHHVFVNQNLMILSLIRCLSI